MSQGIHNTRRDLILEPLAGSLFDESRFSCGNLMAFCTPQESQGIYCITQWAFGHGLSCGCNANLQICKEAKGQGQEVQAKGQTTRAAARSTPPSFIACQSQSHSPRSMHTRRVTNRSPSALRCHHTIREQQIRYETGWWLGCLTFSWLGTLVYSMMSYGCRTLVLRLILVPGVMSYGVPYLVSYAPTELGRHAFGSKDIIRIVYAIMM